MLFYICSISEIREEWDFLMIKAKIIASLYKKAIIPRFSIWSLQVDRQETFTGNLISTEVSDTLVNVQLKTTYYL